MAVTRDTFSVSLTCIDESREWQLHQILCDLGQFILSLRHSHFPEDDHDDFDWFRCVRGQLICRFLY